MPFINSSLESAHVHKITFTLLLLRWYGSCLSIWDIEGSLGTKLASLVTKELMSIADVAIDLAGTPRSS